MRNKILISLFAVLIIVATIVPLNLLYADSTNLVQNGDFSGGLDAHPWAFIDSNGDVLDIGGSHGPIFALKFNDEGETQLSQDITANNLNFRLSFEGRRVNIGDNSSIKVGYYLYKNSTNLGYSRISYGNVSQNFPFNEWVSKNFKLSEIWDGDLPDFNIIRIYFAVTSFGEVYFDNVKLIYEPPDSIMAEPAWIRDTEMKCKVVWVNQDGDFQFSFVYPYADNNWVKIYDMAGSLVYEVDMPYDNPNIIVDLPDGMYTVKTFHVNPATPIQEFVIGKP